MTEIISPDFNIDVKGYIYLGRGPSVNYKGWSRRNGVYYRCAKCGFFMEASNKDYLNCKCGAMSLDIDTGRFGSWYGDENILVYKKA